MQLSVILCNYNHGHYLQERISSLLREMRHDDELLICDDGSTDNSCAIIASFNDPRLVVLSNEKNCGVVASYMKTVRHAKGDFLLSVSADDKLRDGFIKTSLDELQKHPEAAFSCTDYATFVDEKSVPKEYALLPSYKEATCLQPAHSSKLFKETLFRVAGHTVIVKKSLFFSYGGLDAHLGPYCDWYLWHLMALNEPLVYIPKVLIDCRINGTNFSIQGFSQKIQQAILQKLLASPSAKKQFVKSNLLYPFVRKNYLWGCKNPSLWSLFCVTIIQSILKRWQRSLKKRFKREAI